MYRSSFNRTHINSVCKSTCGLTQKDKGKFSDLCSMIINHKRIILDRKLISCANRLNCGPSLFLYPIQ